jgi:hypothetical protein
MGAKAAACTKVLEAAAVVKCRAAPHTATAIQTETGLAADPEAAIPRHRIRPLLRIDRRISSQDFTIATDDHNDDRNNDDCEARSRSRAFADAVNAPEPTLAQ